MKPRNRAIQDAVLACLRSSDYALTVAMIKEALGEQFGYLYYSDIANCLYRLEFNGTIPKRDHGESGSTWWQAEADYLTAVLEEQWAMKPFKRKENNP